MADGRTATTGTTETNTSETKTNTNHMSHEGTNTAGKEGGNEKKATKQKSDKPAGAKMATTDGKKNHRVQRHDIEVQGYKFAVIESKQTGCHKVVGRWKRTDEEKELAKIVERVNIVKEGGKPQIMFGKQPIVKEHLQLTMPRYFIDENTEIFHELIQEVIKRKMTVHPAELRSPPRKGDSDEKDQAEKRSNTSNLHNTPLGRSFGRGRGIRGGRGLVGGRNSNSIRQTQTSAFETVEGQKGVYFNLASNQEFPSLTSSNPPTNNQPPTSSGEVIDLDSDEQQTTPITIDLTDNENQTSTKQHTPTNTNQQNEMDSDPPTEENMNMETTTDTTTTSTNNQSTPTNKTTNNLQQKVLPRKLKGNIGAVEIGFTLNNVEEEPKLADQLNHYRHVLRQIQHRCRSILGGDNFGLEPLRTEEAKAENLGTLMRTNDIAQLTMKQIRLYLTHDDEKKVAQNRWIRKGRNARWRIRINVVGMDFDEFFHVYNMSPNTHKNIEGDFYQFRKASTQGDYSYQLGFLLGSGNKQIVHDIEEDLSKRYDKPITLQYCNMSNNSQVNQMWEEAKKQANGNKAKQMQLAPQAMGIFCTITDNMTRIQITEKMNKDLGKEDKNEEYPKMGNGVR